MPQKSDCKQSHVLVKQGCDYISRVVYGEGKEKYVKLNGRNVSLSSIRGKYRYADKVR